MVEHSLRLGLDPLLPPPCHYPANKRYFLPDGILEKLKYELIFDELNDPIVSQLERESLKNSSDAHALFCDMDFDEPED